MPIETIVIVGGGVAAWLSALALARKTRCAITVVETGGIDDSLGLPFTVETTLPSITQLHELLGLADEQVVRATGSSYALGRALSNWTGDENHAFHPYGEIGASLGPVGFQHLVARLRGENPALNFANYSIAALCAMSGRFAPPPADSRSVLSTLDYGLHLNMGAYRDFIKGAATRLGVTAISAVPTALVLDDQGFIEAVDLEQGEAIAADLFLDCSGQARLLASKMPGAIVQDWGRWLPCNHIRTSQTPATTPPPLYAHTGAHENGWQRFTATQTILEDVVVSGKSGSGGYDYHNGCLSMLWNGNCIAIGGSAALIDPLASTQLHLVKTAIERLLKLFPNDRNAKIEAAEYNRQTIEELDNVRDFAILHYKCNRRIGEAFWDDCRAMPIPDRLAHKIAVYESCGRVALHDEESFETWDWIAVFDALGIRPRSYDTIANGIAKDKIDAHLAHVRNVMLKAIASLPTQHEFLQSREAAA